MKNIVSFGETIVDFLAQPSKKKNQPQAFLQYAGGAAANVSVAIAQLGGAARFVGTVGEDIFGDFLLDQLRTYGVNTDYVVRSDRAETELVFLQLDAHGERSFHFHGGSSAHLQFNPSDFREGLFRHIGIFHFCSNSLNEADIANATHFGIKLAREHQALISLDLNWRAGLWSPKVDPFPPLWKALLEADIVKLSQSELCLLVQNSADFLGSEAAVIKRLFKGRAQWLIVTNGAEPIRWYTKKSQGKMSSFNVPTINSTGAGDAFIGGILFRLAQEEVTNENFDSLLAHTQKIEEIMRFAAAVGALSVGKHGTFPAMPKINEVKKLLVKNYE